LHPAVPGRRVALRPPLPIAGQRGQAQPLLPAELNLAQPAGFIFGYQLPGFRATPPVPRFHHLCLLVHPFTASRTSARGQMGWSDAYEEPLAGKSTLNRLELGGEKPSRYKKIHCRQEALDDLLIQVFLEAHAEAPQQIVLDLDTTDLPLEGHQEGRFFHGYYDCYCYLPLYIFVGEHLLCARLRTADQDAAAGSKDEVARIVNRIRAAWPEVRIIVRADSGFCREELIKWCEDNGVYYVIGFARNERLRRIIEPQIEQAAQIHKQTGKVARVFTEFSYQTTTGSWSRSRRVVAKAEQLDGKENPRFVVTNLSAEEWPAQALYEELYCARGEMENRIKEQLSLFAYRVSAETMKANQL